MSLPVRCLLPQRKMFKSFWQLWVTILCVLQHHGLLLHPLLLGRVFLRKHDGRGRKGRESITFYVVIAPGCHGIHKLRKCTVFKSLQAGLISNCTRLFCSSMIRVLVYMHHKVHFGSMFIICPLFWHWIISILTRGTLRSFYPFVHTKLQWFVHGEPCNLDPVSVLNATWMSPSA